MGRYEPVKEEMRSQNSTLSAIGKSVFWSGAIALPRHCGRCPKRGTDAVVSGETNICHSTKREREHVRYIDNNNDVSGICWDDNDHNDKDQRAIDDEPHVQSVLDCCVRIGREIKFFF